MRILGKIALTVALAATLAVAGTGNPGQAPNSHAAPAGTPYRLTVSFFSVGAGIDQGAKAKLDQFLASRTRKVAVTKIPRGIEGELDYCFPLTEFTPSGRREFIRHVKRLLAPSDLVRISTRIYPGQR